MIDIDYLEKIASNFDSYDNAKKVYDLLPRSEQLLVTPKSKKYVNSDYAIYRKVEADGKGNPIGFLDLYTVPTMPKSEAFTMLAVSPKARGKGLGKKMLNEAKTWAKNNNIGLRYSHAVGNEASKALAESAGLQKIKETKQKLVYKA